MPTNSIDHLHAALVELAQNPYPDVPNPPGVSKRASVALIVRIQPTYRHWPPTEGMYDF